MTWPSLARPLPELSSLPSAPAHPRRGAGAFGVVNIAIARTMNAASTGLFVAIEYASRPSVRDPFDLGACGIVLRDLKPANVPAGLAEACMRRDYAAVRSMIGMA